MFKKLVCQWVKSPDNVTVIKVSRLEWLGHVARMESEGTVKKLLDGKPRERKTGRPRLRWMDDVGEMDWKNMGTKRRRT